MTLAEAEIESRRRGRGRRIRRPPVNLSPREEVQPGFGAPRPEPREEDAGQASATEDDYADGRAMQQCAIGYVSYARNAGIKLICPNNRQMKA